MKDFCCAQRTVFEAWTSIIVALGGSTLLRRLLPSWTCSMEACFCCFSPPALKRNYKKTMKISTLNRFLIIKHFLYAQMIGRAAVWKGPRCTLFQTVVKLLDLLKVQAVVKLDMLHLQRLLFWLLKCRCTCAEKHSVKNNHDFQ